MCSGFGQLYSLACNDAGDINAAVMRFEEFNDPDDIKVKLEGNVIRLGVWIYGFCLRLFLFPAFSFSNILPVFRAQCSQFVFLFF